MSGITTHVLDTARGRPAEGVEVTIAVREGERWRELDHAITDAQGRVGAFPGAEPLAAGVYRLRFETGAYFRAAGVETFWPHVEIAFDVTRPADHHHVPLLLSPFGFATYRGS